MRQEDIVRPAGIANVLVDVDDRLRAARPQGLASARRRKYPSQRRGTFQKLAPRKMRSNRTPGRALRRTNVALVHPRQFAAAWGPSKHISAAGIRRAFMP